MTSKPPHLRPEFAERFKDPDVARAYRSRPPYPPETFAILSGLMTDRERKVLDVGCGTGAIARYIARVVDKVDAVDFSGPMIEVAKTLPGGDGQNITWKVGRIEDVELDPFYSLIVGGQSLHWTDWAVVFPRFRKALSPDGYLALVDLDGSVPWKSELDRIFAEFSTNPDYRPYDMVKDWQGSGLFDSRGEKKTAPVPFSQSLDDYLAFLHSMSSLTRNSMSRERASAFDEEIRRLVVPHSQKGDIEMKVSSTIVWGTLG